jgi:hypothetical protein
MAKKKVAEEKRNTRMATLRSVLSRQKNIRVLLGQVIDIDPLSKRVRLAGGATFEYDSLIVSAGSQTSYYGHDAWREWAPGMNSIEEATNIRHKILYAFAAQRRASHRQGRSGRSRTPLGRYRQEPNAVRQLLLRLSRLRNGRPVSAAASAHSWSLSSTPLPP